jgi:hypothetical protein
MAFDAIELLNAFDIIKNETLYSHRLQKLADAQAELNTSKYIVETVEIAQARLEEANDLLAKHRNLISNSETEIEKLKQDKLKELLKKEDSLRVLEQKLRAEEKLVKEQLELNKVERRELSSLQAQLVIKNEEIQKHLQESTDIRNTYIRKTNELKSIVNN